MDQVIWILSNQIIDEKRIEFQKKGFIKTHLFPHQPVDFFQIDQEWQQ